MAKKFKPKKIANKGWMECDICEKTDFQFRIHLKKENFSSRGTKKERNARQVCFNCASYLFTKKIYNFSYAWREAFFDQLKRVGSNESKKERYMEVHV